MIKKGKTTMMKRRVTAIIAIVIAIILLSVALAVVMDYVRTSTITDPVDGATYYVRYRDKEYAVYDQDKKTAMTT